MNDLSDPDKRTDTELICAALTYAIENPSDLAKILEGDEGKPLRHRVIKLRRRYIELAVVWQLKTPATNAEIEAARDEYGSNEIEVDEDAQASRGQEGYWVQGWLFLRYPDNDHLTCPDCGGVEVTSDDRKAICHTCDREGDVAEFKNKEDEDDEPNVWI